MKEGDKKVIDHYLENSIWVQRKIGNVLVILPSIERKWKKKGCLDSLMALITSWVDVRGKILRRKPQLNIREVFANIRREEISRRVMLNYNPSGVGSHFPSGGSSRELEPFTQALSNTQNGKWIGTGPGLECLKTTNEPIYKLLMQNENCSNLKSKYVSSLRIWSLY